MRKAILIGVSAAIMTWSSSASAQQVRGYAAQVQPAAYAGATLTEAHIAHIRNALRLTPAQAQHWPAVEAALRDLAQRAQSVRRSGLAQQLSIASEVRRLIAIANPLIRTLSPAQRREGMRVAQSMGVSRMVASAF